MKNDERGKSTKMIHVVTRFWTDNLPYGSDEKTAWASGVVYLKANKARGIKPAMLRFSNVKEDYLEKLVELLKSNGIKLKAPPKKTEDVI